MEEYLRIGIVTSPHGVKGEVKVYPTTDDMNRFMEVEYVFVDRKSGREKMDVESVKYFKNLAILKLSGIPDRTAAENYRNAELMIHRSQSAPLGENEYFYCDLIGLKTYLEDGTLVGEITEILETGANNVFVIKKEDGRELLLPDIPPCILNTDIEGGKMTIYILPGLED